MNLFNRKKTEPEVSQNEILAKIIIEAAPRGSSYIEIYKGKSGQYHLRIMGGNHKIRFHSESYYSRFNVMRAATLFSQETNLKIVDRRGA